MDRRNGLSERPSSSYTLDSPSALHIPGAPRASHVYRQPLSHEPVYVRVVLEGAPHRQITQFPSYNAETELPQHSDVVR